MRGLEPWMRLAEPIRQKTIAAHHEEDTRLAEDQHKDDRRQSKESSETDRIAEAGKAKHLEHMRQRLVRTDQCLGIFRHGALTRQLRRTGFERHTEGIENRQIGGATGGENVCQYG